MYNFHDKDCDNRKFVKKPSKKRSSKVLTKEELILLRRNENRASFGMPPISSK